MKPAPRKDYLMPSAAYITCATVSGFTLYLLMQRNTDAQLLSVCVGLIIVNAIAMWASMTDHPAERWLQMIGLAIQLASALALGWLLHINFLPIYTVIWIAMVGAMAPWRLSLALLIGVLAAWYFIMQFGWGMSGAIFSVMLYGTFHLFALLTTRNAQLADAARQEVEALNRELLATQQLLAEASKQTERTRIARDLHDLLGHHLTALSIQLQIAERLTEGEAQTSISEARALARLLLSDVREVVSTLRREDALDLAAALTLLVENVPALDITLDIEAPLNINDVDTAEAILRCVQESLTNTLRHAKATHSWIRLWREDNGVRLTVRDDGKAPTTLREGNGFKGLRERIDQLDGRFEVAVQGGSLSLSVYLPGAS